VLQWGRVLWDAERRPPRRFDPPPRRRFNGAASCGTRKEGIVLPSLVSDELASMGPRLVGRGKALPKPRTGAFPPRFNGAASCGTRKGERKATWHTTRFSFNGAASCGTRKV